MDISKYRDKAREHKLELVLFLAIFAIGIFLRTYHFSSWLHFEIDQTYDFNIVSSAVEKGPGNLPLLGPTAGGGRALRLGPAFYYLEYLAALVFGNTPTGHAMLVLILSISAIPLFYFFCKRYFPKSISLTALAIFAVSFYNVSYSRFSWSPNVLPFLVLLSLFALLKSVDLNELKRERWFLVAAAAGAITTQIHFNAFFTLPAIVILFLLIKRPRFSLQTWVMAFLITAAIYSPMIASDFKTKGENLNFFEKKIFKANDGAIRFKQSFLGDLQHNALAYFFITTGQGEIDNKKIQNFTLLDIQQPTKTFLFNLFALLFFITGLSLLIKNILTEKDPAKKDFLTIIALWIVSSFLYFFSIVNSYRMYPRFFLLVSPIAIVFLALILKSIYSMKFWKNSRINLVVLIFVTSVLAISNMSEIVSSFAQLQGNNSKQQKLETEDIFPNTNRITLTQQENIAAYIFSIAKENDYPVYISTTEEYKPAFWYHLERLGISYYGEAKDDPPYREANYFSILPNYKPDRIDEIFNIKDKKKFGSLTVYYYMANDNFTTNKRQNEKDKEQTEETKNILDLPTWNKLF